MPTIIEEKTPSHREGEPWSIILELSKESKEVDIKRDFLKNTYSFCEKEQEKNLSLLLDFFIHFFIPIIRIFLLKKKYTFINEKEVENFLLRNKELIDILFEAPSKIFEVFGKVPLYLELHRDPEEDWEELFIVIKTSYNPEKAVSLMDELGEKWFLNIIDKVGNKLCIAEEPL